MNRNILFLAIASFLSVGLHCSQIILQIKFTVPTVTSEQLLWQETQGLINEYRGIIGQMVSNPSSILIQGCNDLAQRLERMSIVLKEKALAASSMLPGKSAFRETAYALQYAAASVRGYMYPGSEGLSYCTIIAQAAVRDRLGRLMADEEQLDADFSARSTQRASMVASQLQGFSKIIEIQNLINVASVVNPAIVPSLVAQLVGLRQAFQRQEALEALIDENLMGRKRELDQLKGQPSLW